MRSPCRPPAPQGMLPHGREPSSPRHNSDRWPGAYLRRQLEAALLAPIRALRWNYLPLLMVYFAYGALGIVAIAQSFWVKSALTMTPADLAALSVWLALPWAVKMVFGELVDSVPVLGSQRRVYVFIGAALVAAGLLMLAGVAGGAITFAKPDTVYVIASLLVRDRRRAAGRGGRCHEHGGGVPHQRRWHPAAVADIDRDLGMVQVLGRLALSGRHFLGGRAVGLSGADLLLSDSVPDRAHRAADLGVGRPAREAGDQRAAGDRLAHLGGGIAFGLLVTVLSVAGVPFAQEIVFVLSMAVIIAMLRRVTGQISAEARATSCMRPSSSSRSGPRPPGRRLRWFTIDVLGFDEGFYGVLQQTAPPSASRPPGCSRMRSRGNPLRACSCG